jgi:hypothetical protein
MIFMLSDYYGEDDGPIKCYHCDSTDIDHITRDITANVISEYSCVCQNCQQVIGYWAFGYYDPSFKKQYL